MRTTTLVTDHGGSVALVHPPGAAGLVHPACVASRSDADVRAWKYVVFFGFRVPTAVQAPVDYVFAVDWVGSDVVPGPRAIRIVEPATGFPPSVSVPLSFHLFVFAV
jgi:hypothetical protein